MALLTKFEIALRYVAVVSRKTNRTATARTNPPREIFYARQRSLSLERKYGSHAMQDAGWPLDSAAQLQLARAPIRRHLRDFLPRIARG